MRLLLLRCGILSALLIGLLITSGSAQHRLFKSKKKIPYEEVTVEDIIKRYYERDETPLHPLEGIYAVSCTIVQTKKSFLFGRQKERVVKRQDNYARVAVIKERPGGRRDFMEVSLSFREADRYPVMGEFHQLAEGGVIYTHIEPDGRTMSFAMYGSDDLYEGSYSIMDGSKKITYNLSYLRVFPGGSPALVNNDQ